MSLVKGKDLYQINIRMRSSQRDALQKKAKQLGLKVKDYCLRLIFNTTNNPTDDSSINLGEFFAAVEFVGAKNKKEFLFNVDSPDLLYSFTFLKDNEWFDENGTIENAFNKLDCSDFKLEFKSETDNSRFKFAYYKKLYSLNNKNNG